ncbi:MAG: xylulokinase [Solirubrobacteraceae bacterium]
MSEPVLIGADIGTTKVKAAGFTLEGRQLTSAARAYPTARPAPGHVEQAPADWWSALESVFASLAEEIPLEAVASVGVCSQVNTHVFVDAGGHELRPAITWQDQRCAQLASELDARITDDQRRALWQPGFHLDASNLLARAEWVRRVEPRIWQQTRWILTPKDYVNLRVTGAAATDPLSSIGLVATSGETYLELDPIVAGAVARLPPVRNLATRCGETDGTVLGLPAGIAVAVGTMDAWGSVYGSGVVADGQGFQVSGTSEILGLVGNAGTGAAGAVAFPPYRGLRLFAGPTQAGGDSLRWFSEARHRPISWTLTQAERAPEGADGVVFLPHLAGERAPLWDPDLRGGFIGLGLEHGEHHLCGALLEGVAFSARQLLEVLEEAASCRPTGLALSGGGAASDLWSQIKADVLSLPLARLAVLDSGVLGAALFGGVAAGILADLETAARQTIHTDRVFEPRPETVERYEEAYRSYRSVQAALTPVFHERARRAGLRSGVRA